MVRTRINLLPWREELKRQRDKQLIQAGVGALVLVALLVFLANSHLNSLIAHQNERNDFLQGKISSLEKQLKEINELKKKRDALIARMGIIQDLQNDRSEIVHLFDDLVEKLPQGVYLTEFSKQGKKILLTGVAQSNARVSSLMRNLDSSTWYEHPELNVINVAPDGGQRVSKFTLNLDQEARADEVTVVENESDRPRARARAKAAKR